MGSPSLAAVMVALDQSSVQMDHYEELKLR
jgi:hypothetical protein